MKTIREQADARRRSKLNAIARQVKSGRLVVRQMTPEERAELAPQGADAKNSAQA